MTRFNMLTLFGFPLAVADRSRGGWEAVPHDVELPRHGRVSVARSLDVVGDNCLRTNLLTKKALDHARPGEVVEILSDNLSAVETIPFMLPNHQCVHLATRRDAACWRIYARKQASSSEDGEWTGGKAR